MHILHAELFPEGLLGRVTGHSVSRMLSTIPLVRRSHDIKSTTHLTYLLVAEVGVELWCFDETSSVVRWWRWREYVRMIMSWKDEHCCCWTAEKTED
jgi:hypothetical protein